MKFPLVSDIATTLVSYVDITSSIANALDMMLEQNHRNIIVIDSDCFRVLTVLDVLQIEKNKICLDIKLSELNLSKVPEIHKDENVLNTLEFLDNEIEYICVVNSDKTLYGLITHTDITTSIDPDTLMDNYRLLDFLKLGRRMKWVNKDTTISSLLKDMLSETFDNVIVVEDMKPIGILTTKDVMKLIKYKNDMDVKVIEHMSSPVDTVNKTASIKTALDFIKEKHYKRVIAVDDEGNLFGIISQKEIISLTYSSWSVLMKEYHQELNEINNKLENKSKEYEALASLDHLTGLYNRYKFAELYLSSYTVMLQRDNDMSLIMLDIDFFKKVNDEYGHNAGDQVLIKVSNTILNMVRNVDIVCRWGGEEFLILLPTASLDKTLILAEKLRKQINALKIDVVGCITASFGVAQVIKGENMETLIDRADKSLYLAKESGRNCVKTELDI